MQIVYLKKKTKILVMFLLLVGSSLGSEYKKISLFKSKEIENNIKNTTLDERDYYNILAMSVASIISYFSINHAKRLSISLYQNQKVYETCPNLNQRVSLSQSDILQRIIISSIITGIAFKWGHNKATDFLRSQKIRYGFIKNKKKNISLRENLLKGSF